MEEALLYIIAGVGRLIKSLTIAAVIHPLMTFALAASVANGWVNHSVPMMGYTLGALVVAAVVLHLVLRKTRVYKAIRALLRAHRTRVLSRTTTAAAFRDLRLDEQAGKAFVRSPRITKVRVM
ncbi:hypothetical protein CGZ98_07695 [Enemella evansiae]|uniref:hypothetical protein n=1 Tax=Enemella evansiae TaxID=2016499 RepID=UPI000B97B248|nr:hypothetical protein [Enemella evansiae]OYO12064.1 hypothetical protein CGZ98_07695 [Enemella evansiae]